MIGRTTLLRSIICCIGITMAIVSFGQQKTRILFVLDASNSMNGKWQSEDKMSVAKRLLDETLNELKGTPDLELALRVYGHGSSITFGEQNCDDTELLVPFGSYRYTQISEALAGITPQGTTPIARSIERAAGDFPDAEADNIIILITDGIEACDEDPCAASLALQRKGIVLKPFVIGIGMDEIDTDAFECIGRYYDATSEETFSTVLKAIVSQALNNTTAQVNLLDEERAPIETNVPLSFINSDNGKVVYQFVHTMNKAGHPDTLDLDPAYTYDVIAHTLPPVTVEFTSLIPGGHTTIEIDTPQGAMDLSMNGRNAYKDLKCLVRVSDEQDVINVQDFNSTERYLTGIYDLVVLTLPRTAIPNVKIKGGTVTPVSIPTPGVLNLDLPSAGFGCIQQMYGQDLDWVCSLAERETQQQFVLQPGTYKVLYRARNAKQSLYSIEKEFTIRSEESVMIQL
jgi:Ca-activated chloride channel family protein